MTSKLYLPSLPKLEETFDLPTSQSSMAPPPAEEGHTRPDAAGNAKGLSPVRTNMLAKSEQHARQKFRSLSVLSDDVLRSSAPNDIPKPVYASPLMGVA